MLPTLSSKARHFLWPCPFHLKTTAGAGRGEKGRNIRWRTPIPSYIAVVSARAQEEEEEEEEKSLMQVAPPG